MKMEQHKNNNINTNTTITNNNNAINNNTSTTETEEEAAKPSSRKIFHDFLGGIRNGKGKGEGWCVSDSSRAVTKLSAVEYSTTTTRPQSPSASVSVGGGPIISFTSDLVSERQVRNHLEGVPFYVPRSDFSGPEISNRFAGSKRSNSDSAFMGSTREGFRHMRPDSLESSHLMKILRNAGGERPRHPRDEEAYIGMHPMRPTSASLVLQQAASGRHESKWERSIPMNVGPTAPYPPRAGQVVPFGYQTPTNRFKDNNAGPSIISQAAADEGSRTGIKGSGILSSVNAFTGISDKNPSGLLPSGDKQKTKTHIIEPESSTAPSRQGLATASRQMTIFYSGQAHVFDDVHPNKADVIMALAGSNGGSWSTNYAPKSAATSLPGENYRPSGENDTTTTSNFASSSEFRGKLSVAGKFNHGPGPGNRISMQPEIGDVGVHQGTVVVTDARAPVQAAELITEQKREA